MVGSAVTRGTGVVCGVDTQWWAVLSLEAQVWCVEWVGSAVTRGTGVVCGVDTQWWAVLPLEAQVRCVEWTPSGGQCCH